MAQTGVLQLSLRQNQRGVCGFRLLSPCLWRLSSGRLGRGPGFCTSRKFPGDAAAGTTSEPTGLARGQSVPPSSHRRPAGLSPHISIVTETQPPRGPRRLQGLAIMKASASNLASSSPSRLRAPPCWSGGGPYISCLCLGGNHPPMEHSPPHTQPQGPRGPRPPSRSWKSSPCSLRGQPSGGDRRRAGARGFGDERLYGWE